MKKPTFEGGMNIALKIPKVHYEATISFYRDVLELPLSTNSDFPDTYTCKFGPVTLWFDKMENYSQTDVWLELRTDDLEAATKHLQARGVQLRDELEPFPEGFKAHWISGPAGVVYLLNQTQSEATS